MTIFKPKDNQVKTTRPRYMRLWLLLLFALVCLTTYLYYQHQLRQENFANSNYFRVLSETSAKINENLEQLITLHKNCESDVGIRSIFISYQRNSKSKPKTNPQGCVFSVDAPPALQIDFKRGKALINSIETIKASETGSNTRTTNLGEVDLIDIFPKLSYDFSGYLIADKNNEVIASTDNRSGLSITNVDSIGRIISQKQNQSWQSLSSSGVKSSADQPVSLPGHSQFIDMELMSLDYRVFIYPFRLFEALEVEKNVNQVNLNMIGILPKSALQAHQNSRWNLSLLSLGLVLLIFAWMMARLFMLSNNQPVGTFFYRSIMLSSYLLFVMVFSLLISFAETQMNQHAKQANAAKLIYRIEKDFSNEMISIFNQLSKYKNYYSSIIQEYASLKQVDKSENSSPSKRASQCLRVDSKKLKQITNLFPHNLSAEKILIEKAINKDQKIANTAEAYYLPSEQTNENYWDSVRLKSEYYCANLVNFYAGGLKPIQDNPYSERFSTRHEPSVAHKLLNVTAVDAKEGISNLPSFYSIETNRARANYSLLHRRYFRDVRDQRGWGILNASEKNFVTNNKSAASSTNDRNTKVSDQELTDRLPNNWYIQRLRNLGNGTKGTTLALPLTKTDALDQDSTRHILVSDIELASLNMTELGSRKELMDLTFIIIDRDSGEVLFHIDDSRVLIENFYHSGQGTAKIAHLIRSGLGGNSNDSEWTKGFYHGVPGKFWYQNMPVKQWALIAFMPDESLTLFMTNIFLINTLSISFCILLIAFVIVLLRLIPDTGKLKTQLSIPLVIDRRKTMVFTSIFVTSIYMGCWLAFNTQNSDTLIDYNSLLFVSIVGLTCLSWGYFEYQRYYRHSLQAKRAPINIIPGAAILSIAYFSFGVLIFCYLSAVASLPASGLNWYYSQNVYPARLVQERNEIHKIALSRFPNTISRYNVDPLSLMPISAKWKEELDRENLKKPFLQPKDVASYSKLIYASNAQGWMVRYLANQWKSPLNSKENKRKKKAEASNVAYKPILYYLSILISFLALCYIWLLFNRKILSVRLYGPSNFLRHLNQTVNRCEKQQIFEPRKGILIDLVDKPMTGISFDLQLKRWHLNQNSVPTAVSRLFNMTPLISSITNTQQNLPNLKIAVTECNDKLAVEIWGFKTIMENPSQRPLLLSLINEFKSLQLANDICSLTMYSGFQNVKRQFLKISNISIEDPAEQFLVNTEYLEWAECFKDFSVRLPEVQNKNLDIDFILQEIKVCPWLKFIGEELNISERAINPNFNFMRWLTIKESDKTQAEWSSLSHILSKVEALYRFKWESCTENEKLTLYYLVTNKRVNPANLNMLEQLTRKGLIMVKRGRVHIINKSFAHFINQAENKETIQKMVDHGNLGMWQNYRVPVTLLVILIIGGIALMSGSSLYIIVASIMGLLGTISSLTSSANLIHSNLKGD